MVGSAAVPVAEIPGNEVLPGVADEQPIFPTALVGEVLRKEPF